mgnify:CR=1 FL=1
MTDRRTEEYSAAREVWRKFRGSRTAMTGLLLILLLCAVAVFAPLIANGKPLLVLMDGSLSSPAFRAMTAPESSELFVEKTFNYLMLLLPALLLLRLFAGKRRGKYFRIAAALLALLLLIPFLTHGRRIDKTPWREIAATMKKPDFALFAPVPYGPFETAPPTGNRRGSTGSERTTRDGTCSPA